jgi:hypothetical protein
VHTRETASDGYHQASAARQAAWPERHVDHAIAEAMEAQTRGLREFEKRLTHTIPITTGLMSAPCRSLNISPKPTVMRRTTGGAIRTAKAAGNCRWP